MTGVDVCWWLLQGAPTDTGIYICNVNEPGVSLVL